MPLGMGPAGARGGVPVLATNITVEVIRTHVADAVIAPVSMQTLFEMYKTPCVIDMVDIDIQGGEYPLFEGDYNVELLSRRAKFVHIGLHSLNRTLDRVLVQKFEGHGWRRVWYWPRRYHFDTFTARWGPVRFADGIMSFANPRPVAQSCVGERQQAQQQGGDQKPTP
eukprot:gene3579-6278_t